MSERWAVFIFVYIVRVIQYGVGVNSGGSRVTSLLFIFPSPYTTRCLGGVRVILARVFLVFVVLKRWY